VTVGKVQKEIRIGMSGATDFSFRFERGRERG